MRVWHQGQRHDAIQDWDRGVQFGDGLFETVKVIAGKPVALDHHARRLQLGFDTLGIHAEPASNLLQQSCDALADGESGVLKLIVTRGNSARGYRVASALQANITAFFSALPEFDSSFSAQGVRVGLCHTQAAMQTQLAGLKHLNRLDSVLASQELQQQPSWQEGLMLNAVGQVVEGTMSNLFLRLEDHWCTPALTHSGVSGILRQRLLESRPQTFSVAEITRDDLARVSEMFICNSLIGIWPVRELVLADTTRSLTISTFVRDLQQQIELQQI